MHPECELKHATLSNAKNRMYMSLLGQTIQNVKQTKQDLFPSSIHNASPPEIPYLPTFELEGNVAHKLPCCASLSHRFQTNALVSASRSKGKLSLPYNGRVHMSLTIV